MSSNGEIVEGVWSAVVYDPLLMHYKHANLVSINLLSTDPICENYDPLKLSLSHETGIRDVCMRVCAFTLSLLQFSVSVFRSVQTEYITKDTYQITHSFPLTRVQCKPQTAFSHAAMDQHLCQKNCGKAYRCKIPAVCKPIGGTPGD